MGIADVGAKLLMCTAIAEAATSKDSAFYHFFKSIKSFYERQDIVLFSLVAMFFMIIGEEVLEKQVYHCPSSPDLAYTYGVSYIVGTTTILWMLSVLVYNANSKMYYGICKGCTCDKCGAYSIAIFLKTSTIPLAWIVILLIDGDYIACIHSKEPETADFKEYQWYKSTSQYCGWIVFSAVIFIALLVQGFLHGAGSKSFLLHKQTSMYNEAEEKELIRQMEISVQVLAPKVVKNFMEMEKQKECDWAKEVMISTKSDEHGIYFSPLHKLFEQKERLNSGNFEEIKENIEMQQNTITKDVEANIFSSDANTSINREHTSMIDITETKPLLPKKEDDKCVSL